MSMDTIAPTHDLLRAFAAAAREKFAGGQRMSIRNSTVVHAVDRERWVAGEMIPQPLCHTATYGWSLTAMRAVRTPITCLKCRRILASPDEILLGTGEYQPPLFHMQRAAA